MYCLGDEFPPFEEAYVYNSTGGVDACVVDMAFVHDNLYVFKLPSDMANGQVLYVYLNGNSCTGARVLQMSTSPYTNVDYKC